MAARGSSPFTGETQENQPAKIFSDLSTLFLSERYSYVTIISRHRIFPGHRAIISSQCPLYDSAIRYAPMGLHTPVLRLPKSDGPEVVLRLLQHLYTGNYDDNVLQPELLKGPSKFATMTQPDVVKELQKPFSIVVADNDESEPTKDDKCNPEGTPDSIDVVEDYCEKFDENDVNGDETPPRSKLRWDASNDLVKDLHGKRRDLVLHARLHLMANKCDLPGLSLLARDRFYRAAELADEHFPTVAAEIYDAPVADSSTLREIAGRIIGNNFTDDKFRERLAPVMAGHVDLALDVMNVLARRARDRKW